MPRARALLAAAGYAALAVTDSYLAGKTGSTARRARYLVKPALMPALTAAFLEQTKGRSGSRAGLLRNGTAAAQACSWGGDVALLGSSQGAFLAGVASFFGAHVCYIAAFLSVRGNVEGFDAAGLKAALGLLVAGGPAMSLAAGRTDPRLGIPVAAYATTLSAMVASSRMIGPAVPARARRMLRAGTMLFLVSDSILGAEKFLFKEPRPALERAVMATYTPGRD